MYGSTAHCSRRIAYRGGSEPWNSTIARQYSTIACKAVPGIGSTIARKTVPEISKVVCRTIWGREGGSNIAEGRTGEGIGDA
eukprot:2054412-Rhodomonas_salina.1